MSLVRSAIPGKLGVGVGVLVRYPAADEHPGSGVREPGRRQVSASDHEAGRRVPPSSRTIGVSMRSPTRV